MHQSANINVMLKAARQAARGLQRDFNEIDKLQVSKKGPKDFVTAADFRSEKIIIEHLQQARPDYGFLIEESGEIKGKSKEYRWIVDPLDGTINFMHGLPSFCISIALEKTNKDGSKEITAAVVEAPILGETFTAEKGNRAYVESINGNLNRLQVAKRRAVEDSIMATGSIFGAGAEHAGCIEMLASHLVGVRSSGSSVLDLAYTAAGRYDIFLHKGLQPWDMAAGSLLIKESGGVVTDLNNNKDNVWNGNSIVAANDLLHFKTSKLLIGNKAA